MLYKIPANKFSSMHMRNATICVTVEKAEVVIEYNLELIVLALSDFADLFPDT